MAGAQAARSAATRGAILRAATRAFAERGFHATTTRDIAAAAGLSPAAVYVHHSSKEEILWLIAKDGHEVSLQIIAAAVAGGATPREQLAGVIGDMSQNHAEHHVRARVINYELDALDAEHRAVIDDQRREIVAAIRNLVEAGVSSGEFDTAEPRMAANAALSLVVDVARWYQPEGRWTPEAVGAFNADAALRLVGARH